MTDDQRQPAPELPPYGSPAWHLLEAEQHLDAAERIVDQDAAASPTVRLLAAIANAQVAAVKLATERDQRTGEVLDLLYDINRSEQNTAANTQSIDSKTPRIR